MTAPEVRAELDSAPRLVGLSQRQLVLGPIRLALGGAGFASAIAAGARPAVALLAFVVGAIGAGAVLTGDPRSRGRALPEPMPLPADFTLEAWQEIARRGVFPSTVGVAVLTVVALPFDTTLAALLAGILGGMALATAVSWLEYTALERRLGGRLYTERRGDTLYVESAKPS
jgi:hypothetical protein